MKKSYLFIALAMVAVMAVSCKNNRKAETNDAAGEVVEAAKAILTDDVLATIDELALTIIADSGNWIPESVICSALTEEEKLIRPDYLLEASLASEMVTKSQKLNALAILLVEHPIRIAYGMPTEKTDEVIARLIAEVNDPVDDEPGLTPSEKARKAYEILKGRGDIADFWQFSFAVQTEVNYLISKNPDVFFRDITKEQYDTFTSRYRSCRSAVRVLAEYDEGIASILKTHDESRIAGNDEESDILFETKESAKRIYVDFKDLFVVRRAALLK